MLKRFFGKRETELEAATHLWQEGKEPFPFHNYERHHWPAPFWQLASRDEAVGHCPNCGSYQQMGPRDPFPEIYTCGGCEFNAPHPLYGR